MKRALPPSTVAGAGDTVDGTGVGAGDGVGLGTGAGVDISELHAEITNTSKLKTKISISNDLGRRLPKCTFPIILFLTEVYS